ncbi:hypothetical protein BDM02DRAFT_3096541 [Thelephora ganbajun]|uniref:Uncharacterized protein n=1 Tax=Thelephora ganbajun TaxID=370292 RepID=A0ACB6ZFQ4_THEGA|nr:hypothetical protein BDM02DRAFT_3096541 [Thelephora ganbajun]
MARRTSSATSLARFARANSPEFANRSLDFCNAFWGVGDGGVDVLFARMRGGTRTIDELRAFWKERASIEEEYAKQLARLAKQNLGRDEIGYYPELDEVFMLFSSSELRNSLDTIRLETDKQAAYHGNLAKQIHADLEAQCSTFLARQSQFKRTIQGTIEKEFKTKNTQESYVNKAREKYESDCVRINSYTAQSTLMQGKDLDRINNKLERAQQTVQANEKDFANFSRALQDTVQKWEQDWKAFCDACQDMEEDRMEFMKDNMWAYANAVSTVCVADDESCEKIRVALEQLEPEKDMENFVRDYGTGNAMPDPPQFVNYANPDAIPASSSRPTSRPAHFVRASNRTNQPRQEFIPPPEEEPNPNNNVAGVGSGRRNSVSISDPAINGSSSQRQVNGYGAGGSGQSSGPSAAGDVTSPQTMLRVGDQAHSANPDQNSQSFKPGHSSGGSKVGQENDPLAKQMAELRSASATGRRNSFVQREQQQETGPTRTSDYSNSADMVVGSYPSPSRPVSPSRPTAALMRPPASTGTSTGVNVDAVLADYQQSLPGEGKSHSRTNSRQSQIGSSQLLERPVSREGFAGIGSQGRTPSPTFNGSRNASPIPPHQGSISRPSAISTSTPGHTARQDSVTVPQQKLPNRATTPNSVGIALDPTGKVSIDSMADVYQSQPQHNQSASQPSQYHAPPQNQQNSGFQRRLSTSHSNGSMNISGQHSHIPPQTQPPYGAPPPAPYQQPPPQQPPPQQQPHYMQPPTQQPPPINYQQHHYQPQPEYTQPPAHPAYTQQQQGLARGQSLPGGYYQQPVQPQQQPQQIMNGYRSASPQPVHNQPVQAQQHGVSAAPTGQYTENGRPVLFYVKALYDYTASIEEEFDFQAGDIIAVTSTPEDGWWSGELLDEARRQPGRHVFPSNFVCLF